MHNHLYEVTTESGSVYHVWDDPTEYTATRKFRGKETKLSPTPLGAVLFQPSDPRDRPSDRKGWRCLRLGWKIVSNTGWVSTPIKSINKVY